MKTALKQAGVVGFGFLSYHALNALYAFIFCPYIIWKLGMLYSILIMFLMLIVFCFIAIKIYDRSKSDWLLIDTVKEKLTKEGGNKITKTIAIILKKGEFALLIVILFWDPTITVLYYRKDARSPKNGTERKIFFLFVTSALLCAVSKAGIVSIIFFLWHYILIFLTYLYWYILLKGGLF